MALIEVNFISECLRRTVTVNAIIPFDKMSFDPSFKPKREGFKTLYLLHGIFGNYTDWVSGTRIQRWAEEKGLAVIMPSGENHFYTDCSANGELFSKFIGEELPAKMETLFHLSKKREDRFIAGLSMGGYGAIMNGLTYHNNFSKVCGLSAALYVLDYDPNKPSLGRTLFGNQFTETIFGPEKDFATSNNNVHYLLEKLKDVNDKPELYLCCGVDDSLLEANRTFVKEAKEAGFKVTYEEGPGAHEWDFWDKYIKRIVDWLPLEDEYKGINSGNISE